MELNLTSVETLHTRFLGWFFSEWFWLPTHLSWEDLENKPDDGIYKAQGRDLLYCIPATIAIFCLRKLFESFVARPFGLYMNISTKTYSCPPNAQLEKVYKTHPYPKESQVETLSKQTDLSNRQIQRWFRRKRNQDRPTAMDKFAETAWRLFYYFSILIYGIVVLYDKPWFSNPRECWIGFPKQHVSTGIFMYYMIELGFYLSLIFSQFVDVKRKDFWEQFTHHIATVLLMMFSWTLNLARIGSLVLCLHDGVDWMLEGAKLNRYMNKTVLCDIMFAMFTIGWFITRIVMYPYYILYTTSIEATEVIGYARSVFLFNGLLCVLQFLHILWFIIIMRAAYTAVVVGQVERDIRSCSEESDASNEDANNFKQKNGSSNGIH